MTQGMPEHGTAFSVLKTEMIERGRGDVQWREAKPRFTCSTPVRM